jgi:CheY-like chemotaxis protein
VLLSAFLVVAVAVLLKQHLSPVKPKPVAAAPAAPVVVPAPVPPAVKPAPVIVKTLTPEDREAAIKAEQNRLYDWSMNNDPQSLSSILIDLHSPEKEVRLAAIEAAKQFDDTNAIPVLKAEAASSDDTQEAIAMLEAADFLSIPDAVLGPGTGPPPTLTPEQAAARAQAQANAAARMQAYMAKHHPDQLPQIAPPAPAGN